MDFRFTARRWVCIVFITALAVLSGCAGLGRRLESPEVSLANIAVLEAKGFETAFQLDLRVFNTNDVPLEIKGVDCILEINGEKVAKGVSATQINVAAFGTELVPMKVYSSMFGVISSMLNMVKSAQSKQGKPKLSYKISGRLRLGGDSMMSGSVPFKYKGELDMEGATKF